MNVERECIVVDGKRFCEQAEEMPMATAEILAWKFVVAVLVASLLWGGFSGWNEERQIFYAVMFAIVYAIGAALGLFAVACVIVGVGFLVSA